MHQKEFNVALEEAMRINDSDFKGKLSGNGGMLVKETKQFLQFRFLFEHDDDRGSLTDEQPKSQKKIIDSKGIKLFSGVINSRYKKDDGSKLYVDVFVVNSGAYDMHSRELDRAERLKMLRGGR